MESYKFLKIIINSSSQNKDTNASKFFLIKKKSLPNNPELVILKLMFCF